MKITYDRAPVVPVKRQIKGFTVILSNNMQFNAVSAGSGCFMTTGCDSYYFSKPETLLELSRALAEVAKEIEASR